MRGVDVETKLKEYQSLKYNKNNKFDIDLGFGTKFEKSLAKILSIGKVEVKTERDKWKETRNIAIELSCRGDLSGLNVTEAEWWAHILSYNEEIITILLFPVEELKKLVKWSCSEGSGKIVMGGDEGASELALIPLEDLGREVNDI